MLNSGHSLLACGYQTSSFHLAQTLAMYPLARLSDRIGRKPVILVASVGIAACTAMFGFVDSIWGVIAIRFLREFWFNKPMFSTDFFLQLVCVAEQQVQSMP